METFKDRLLSLFDKDTKPSHIADKIGMSIPGFMRIYNDGFIPKSEGLVKIYEITGCNLTWLLTGEGEAFPKLMHKYPAGKEVSESGLREPPATYDTVGNPVDVDEFVFVPRYNIKAAAGHGHYNHDQKSTLRMAFRRFWVDNYLRVNPKDLSVIGVKGDSMEGVLNNGDTILVNHADKRPGNGLYVIRIGEDLIVKHVQSMPGGRLLVTSSNDMYEPFEIDLKKQEYDDIEIIGKVVWFGRQI